MSTLKQSDQEERSTIMIGADELADCIDMASLIDAIEEAFEAYQKGDATMPPKTYVDIEEHNGDFRAMPAAVGDSAGVKWVNVHPDNPQKFDLPTVMGVVVYSDPETAYPLAIMDGTKLTRFRTGAVAGVASRHLAPSDASSLGLLGAGQQAHTQLDAISNVIDLDQVVISDLDDDAITEFITAESHRTVDIVSGSPQDVANCDVISTTTPSREPILKREWIKDGAHINAIGADAEGKQELESDILADANVIVDDWEQCSHSGEINVPVAEGVLSEEVVHGDLSSVVTGSAPTSDDTDITVFDSTGLAIQDIATAELVYESASEQGLGTSIKLIGA
jgi:alanine dehydrogenase